MKPTVRKIDFFGGLHGNFLELVINCWIDNNPYEIGDMAQFTPNGSCHVKNHQANYKAITTAQHYSWFDMPFDDDDLVIRIVPNTQDLLIAVTNSFTRAGDQVLDIDNLEVDTRSKMESLSKLRSFLDTLVKHHGSADQYPRSVLRKYFYAMFDDHPHGLGMFTAWLPARRTHRFRFGSFFDVSYFLEELQDVSKFVDLEFQPDSKLIDLHRDFLSRNQGYASQIKCAKIMHNIVNQIPMDMRLNIIEEAWINYRLSRMFDLYDHPALERDTYPGDTSEISRLIFATP